MTQKFKRLSTVQVWFLDTDLRLSAQYLTERALDQSLDGCFAVLVDAIFYFTGIRNKKAYQYYFSVQRKQDTINRFFCGWPFRKPPAFRYYTARTAKWARQCGEHFDYLVEYMGIMLEEYQFRHARYHKLQAFYDWLVQDKLLTFRVPKANIGKIYLPWKSLKTRFRRKDVIDGYRLQFMDTYCWEDPIGAYDTSNRNVPDFVVRHYGLSTASMTS